MKAFPYNLRADSKLTYVNWLHSGTLNQTLFADELKSTDLSSALSHRENQSFFRFSLLCSSRKWLLDNKLVAQIKCLEALLKIQAHFLPQIPLKRPKKLLKVANFQFFGQSSENWEGGMVMKTDLFLKCSSTPFISAISCRVTISGVRREINRETGSGSYFPPEAHTSVRQTG